MGMSAGGGKKGAVQSDINVTPLIDVLLVLLIIFMVVMPIMMKMETLEVPRKIQDNEEPDPNAVQLTVKFSLNSTGAGGTVVFNDGEKDATLPFTDLTNTLRPKLEGLKSGTDKVVFVDFDDNVKWGDVVHGMDMIRGIATDIDHDEVKVALKVKEDAAPAAAAPAK